MKSFVPFLECRFNADRLLTRFEMALIVKRLWETRASTAEARAHVEFTDVPADHWALEAVQGAIDSGVLQGWEGKFNGDNQINRYQAAIILKKILAVPERRKD